MVAEALVKEPLTREMIQDGGELAQVMERRLRPIAAFWSYLPESNAWRLYFATPLYYSLGVLESYRIVQSALSELTDPNPTFAVDLHDVSVIEDDHPLVETLRTFLQAQYAGRIQFADGYRSFNVGLPVRHAMVKGSYLEDAYLYMLLPPLKPEEREKVFNRGPAPVENSVGGLAKRGRRKK